MQEKCKIGLHFANFSCTSCKTCKITARFLCFLQEILEQALALILQDGFTWDILLEKQDMTIKRTAKYTSFINALLE